MKFLFVFFLLLQALPVSAKWNANVLCQEFKTLMGPERPRLFFQPKTYEKPIIVGGDVSKGEGPFVHFLRGIEGGGASSFVLPGKGSPEILSALMGSKAELDKSSVILALDLLYRDAKLHLSNCTEEGVKRFYLSGDLPKLVKQKPVILGRVPLENGDVKYLLTDEHKCNVLINAVVNTEICRTHKSHCFWLDLETYYVIKIKDKKEPDPREMGQEICRLLTDDLSMRLRNH